VPGCRTLNQRIKSFSGRGSPWSVDVRTAGQTAYAYPRELGRTVANYNPDLQPASCSAAPDRHRAARLPAPMESSAFFKLHGGLLLGLYERANLAKDASLPPGPPSPAEFSLGIPAASQAKVDKLLRHVEAAGGTPTAPAHMRPFGVYAGYFTDPDGHLFEIAWNSNE
jgi:catechol 2,3-dioxygenase-like lactoylglutathione lyase family enzyme